MVRRGAPSTRRGIPARPAPSVTRGGAPAQGRKLRTQGKNTLQRLLTAGMEVFDSHGFHAARVDDIVKAAKVSHGTFYLYFSDKEDLFGALLLEVAGEMQTLSQSLGPVGPDKAGYLELRDWFGRFFDLYERSLPVIRAWTRSEMEGNEFRRTGVAALSAFSETLIDRLEEIARPPGVTVSVAAVAVVALLERLGYYVFSGHLPVDRDELLDTVTTMVHVGAFGGARRRR